MGLLEADSREETVSEVVILVLALGLELELVLVRGLVGHSMLNTNYEHAKYFNIYIILFCMVAWNNFTKFSYEKT
jgi:hypothetical protein